MKFLTTSGSTYEVADSKVRRIPAETGAVLRADEDWVKLLEEPTITVGHGVTFVLEGLGVLPVTIRTTTPVVKILELS